MLRPALCTRRRNYRTLDSIHSQGSNNSAGGRVSTEPSKPTAKTVTLTARPSALATKEQLLAALRASPPQLLDARSKAEYCGESDTAARNGMIQADPFVHGSASERRAEFRRKGKHVKALLASEDGRQELGWSWVVDRSATGLCLKVDQEMSVGTILSVRPMNAPENTPWMQIEIKNCRPMDIHWEIGCRFVRPPAWSLLLLFG